MLSTSGSPRLELTWNPSFTIEVADGFLIVTCEDYCGRVPISVAVDNADDLLETLAHGSNGLSGLRSGLLRHRILLVSSGHLGREFSPATSKQLGVLSRYGDPDDLQSRLNTAKVLVLGCGAVGLAVAQGLAAAGVRTLSLLDCDVVEASNLNRQYLYTLSDIGCPKTSAAALRLRERYSSLALETFDQRVTCAADLIALYSRVEPDLAVCAIDQPPGVLAWAYEASRSTNVPTLSAAVGLRYGHFGPVATDAPHALTAHSETQEITTIRYSLGTTSAMVSFGACHLALSYLSGLHDSSYWGSIHTIDFDEMSVFASRPSESA